jgi:hypothetical protein
MDCAARLRRVSARKLRNPRNPFPLLPLYMVICESSKQKRSS